MSNMMKITDAREKIIMRKLQRRGQSRPAGKLTDAREILKQKRYQELKKSPFKNVTTPNRKDNFKKQPIHGTKKFHGRSHEKQRKFEKSVSLKGGMITVTARRTLEDDTSEGRPNKQIMANNGGITVVRVNSDSMLRQSPLVATREENLDVEMEEPVAYEFQRPPLHISSLQPFPKLFTTEAPKMDLRSSISRQYPFAKPGHLENPRSLNTLSTMSAQRPQSSAVLVTNLHPSVSEDDILELFSDIGAIRSTRFLQPGTAVIYYLRKTDAEKACLAYHNRLLDGLPMQCTIIPESNSDKISEVPKMTMEFPNQHASVSNYLKSAQPRAQFGNRSLQKPVKFTVRLP